MKIAILSDIHGNVTGLEAVLADAQAAGVDQYWIMGDSFLIGPGHQDLLALLTALPNRTEVRGNWDDYIFKLLSGDFDPNLPEDIYIASLVLYLAEKGGQPVLDYLSSLPMTVTKHLGGLSIGLSHNLPQKNYGRDLAGTADQAQFDRLFEGNQHDIAVIGHSHIQLMRYGSQGQLIINPGSIGQPLATRPAFYQDLRAQYAILTLEGDGRHQVDFRRVAYDSDREIQRAKQAGLPYLDLYQELLEGGYLHTHDNELLAQHPETAAARKRVLTLIC